MLYCGWFETRGIRSSRASACAARISSAADVVRLAGVHDVGERPHRLLERRLVVEAVRLVDVDVVGAEPRERAVDRLHDVLARQAAVVVLAGAGRPVDLGEDLEALAALTLQRLAEHRLRLGVGVDVGGVEGRDALVQRLPDAGKRRVLLHLGPVGQPVAVGDRRDLETTLAEVAELHGPDPRHRAQRQRVGGGQ